MQTFINALNGIVVFFHLFVVITDWGGGLYTFLATSVRISNAAV